MGIYFRDILLIRISRGANNCGQHSLEKNSYFTMRFSPHFQLFYFNDRLEFCEFFEWKIKRINNADLFSQPPLLIFIKGANISGGHCTYTYIFCIYLQKQIHLKYSKIERERERERERENIILKGEKYIQHLTNKNILYWFFPSYIYFYSFNIILIFLLNFITRK